MHASEVTPEATSLANELYWGSDRSVNHIAEELDLSKGTLYSIVEPLRTGNGCPLCGDEVVYPNRTAKDKDLLDCPTCDWDGSSDETITYSASANGSRDVLDDSSATDLTDSGETRPARMRSRDAPHLNTMAGGALIGAALGLALVLWARRR